MQKEKYSLKDFGFNLEMNFADRADYFQNYIDQLDDSKHRAYLAEATTGIGSTMTVKDVYTGESRKVISFVANDYLGMSRHPQTIAAGMEALKKYGTGACAAPIIGGFLEEHKLLEKEIAEFIGQEDAMIFSSGYGANTGVLGSLLGEKDIALVDTFVHMSVTEGLLNTNIKTIGHNDLDYLEMTLRKVENEYITKLVIIDGVYSQDGDIALIPEVLQLCRKYGAFLMVDDAHGIGVSGKTGRGVIEHYDMLGQVDIVTGTLSKSFGSVGGFVGASKNIIRYIKWYAKSSIFSAAITPQATTSSREALKLMKTDSSYREKLWRNVAYLKKCLLENGFDIKNTVSPIFPIMVRDNYKVKKVAAMLLQSGIYAVGICYPAVSRKDARIRASVLSTHVFEDLDNLVENLVKIDKTLNFRQ